MGKEIGNHRLCAAHLYCSIGKALVVNGQTEVLG